jgi:NADH-quinone oxidoreductase subunit J
MISLWSPEGLAGLVFLAIVVTTVTGAIIAACSVRLIRSVVGLAICFIGVAGLYYFLHSPFLAVMEMLIYVGAVCVTIAFAVMLADSHPEEQIGKESALAGPISFLVSGIFFWGLAALAARTNWHYPSYRLNNGSVEAIGRSLLTDYSMVFELLSVVLFVAIIGSLVLAKNGRGLGRSES